MVVAPGSPRITSYNVCYTKLLRGLHARGQRSLDRAYRFIYRLHGPTGVFARSWTTGAIAFWAVIGLFGFLLLYLRNNFV